MKKIFFGFLLISTSIFAQEGSKYPLFPDPLNVKEYTLKNGLKVMLSENHNTPQIFGLVAVKAGGKNDPKEATGMAHYLEHMLFKGTEEMGTWDYEKEATHLRKIEGLYEELGKHKDEAKRGEIQQLINEESLKAGQYAIPNEMDRMLSEIGGSNVNAFTTNDYTAYHNSFPSNKLEQWLQVYAHRFKKPVFRLFQSELETVYEEKNRGMDTPFNYVFEEFLKNFWKNHPYGQQSIIGSTEHLKNPSLEKMYDYFNTYYVANNMVLCLSGDFDSDYAIQLIESYFSDWRTGEIPSFPEYKEEEFKGNESVTVKATPVKGLLRGYRTPENGNTNQHRLQLANYILSNPEGSGLLNNLSNEGKLIMAEFMPMEYNDYGASILIVIPKIIGQSFEDAENLVNTQFERLRKGDFEDAFFEGAKLSLQKEYEKKLEDNEERVMMMMEAFTSNTDWYKYIDGYNQIKSFSKGEIIEVANKYYNSNYFTLYSKMGTPPKDKLAKPKFEPVIPVDGKMSDFYKDWRKTAPVEIDSKFIDFEKDITTSELAKNVYLTSTGNPFNSIFSLSISWGAGSEKDSLLTYTSEFLNKLGTKTASVTEFRDQLFRIGATMAFRTTKNEFILDVEGMDEHYTETLGIIKDFIENFNPTPEAVKTVAEELSTARKMNKNDVSALAAYALYKKESPFLKELTVKQVQKLSPEQLANSFQNVKSYGMQINYTGKMDHNAIAEKTKTLLNITPVANTALSLKQLNENGYESPKVYFLNDKKAVQSQIIFLKEAGTLDINKTSGVNAFNTYFGADMSSLVFQEIREFRSLAYSTYALYRMAGEQGHKNSFIAYVGCQADKTPEAISTMFELIQNMPSKTEREQAVKDALVSNAKTGYPPFRDLIEEVQKYEKMGYQEDPNKKALASYETMNFGLITQFYETNIKNKPYQIVIVGNKKRVNTKTLSKYGKLIHVKRSQILRN